MYIIIIIIKSFYSLWSIGHLRRAFRHCGLQLSPWPHSMIFLCFLSHPLLSFATFSSAYLSFNIPENSNLSSFLCCSCMYTGWWKTHGQTHWSWIYFKIQVKNCECRFSWAWFSSYGLLKIRKMLTASTLESQRRMLHVWTVTAWLAEKFQL